MLNFLYFYVVSYSYYLWRQWVLFACVLSDGAKTLPLLSSGSSTHLPLVSEEATMTLLTSLLFYWSVTPFNLFLDVFCISHFFSAFTFWIVFVCSLNQTGCFNKVNNLCTFFCLWSFSPGLSYGSFTTSYKSLFLWISWNQPMNTLLYVFFWALSNLQLCFSMHFL